MLRASLRYYAATNALVVLGVAVAVAVLAGALLVGASVRESLEQIALGRLGAAQVVVSSPTFFRTALADDVIAKSPSIKVAPVIVAGGAVAHDESKRSAGRVMIYGIDDRFGQLQGSPLALTGREAAISEALAAELGAKAGDSITLRVAKPTDIPLSSLQGRREVTGQRIRLTIARVLDRASMGEFSLAPSQGPVLSLYVSMNRLQRDLDLGDRVNTLLLSAPKGAGDRLPVTLDDLGLRTRTGPANETIIESRAGLITDALAARIAEIAPNGQPALTYVVNAIKIGDREVPYSTVTAIDFATAERRTEKGARPLIWLNAWAARELGASTNDVVTLQYFLWSDEDGLATHSADFTLAGIVPMDGIGGDQTLTPEYPGISDAPDMTSWDPPFPVDLSRVRKRDEDYWDQYRAAPKAIISLADGQRLWGSRYGRVSSLRFAGATTIDARAIDPSAAGITVRNVREDAINAAQGTTDFGEYFLYFSFFLVVSALLLAYLFFAVGLEQRTTEVGILSAMGFKPSKIRGVFLREAAILSAIGAVIGTAAAIAYSALILYGLRTWWVGAVGTTDLTLHVAPEWLATGVIGALIVGLAALWLGVRAMSRRSARSLLKGEGSARSMRSSMATKAAALLLLIIGAGLLAAAMTRSMDPTAGFFGAGGAWLVAGLCVASIYLRRRRSSSQLGRGFAGLFALGMRHTSVRPARSILSLALIAFASFVLVSVGAFKKDVSAGADDPRSGTGGFALMAESVAPLMHDPNTPAGRDGLGLESSDPILSATTITRFRLRPGDETSCLTLYRPANPRIIAPEPRFFTQPRFSFASSMATTAEEIANPWLLLKRTFEDGAIATIADQTTLMYVLHLGVGDDFVFTPGDSGGLKSPTVRLRIVGALADSFLQSELIIGEPAFVQLFPKHEGYRVWMIQSAPDQKAAVTTHLEDRMSDYGLDVIDTHQRWASYHQVENTYLATFQALGSLGLLLGTVGLGAVLARNVLERRREIGLLRAVGYSPADIRGMVLSEGMALVAGGLLLGAGCALVAITPALRDRAQAVPWTGLAALLISVVITGLLASLVAIKLTTNTPLTTAIKSE
ncbi:MAG TPA: FtsX-like permease family protein [Vicinamibacterales bacterium]|nr:FtsX-like permease family protein [Vicinamibacterales bacterium]